MTGKNKVLAFLPEHLLYAASRFTNHIVFRDFQKYILIEPVASGGVQIHSTDGCRASRIICSYPIWYCTKPILIDRRAFPRYVKSLRVVRIDQLGRRQLCSGRVYGGMSDMSKDHPTRSISSDIIKLRSKNFSYPNMRDVWPQDILDHQNTVSFDGNCLYDFLEKVKRLADQAVKRLAGDSEELTNEEVNNLLKACVVNVQTRQDNNNGSSKLIFTAYNGQELEIPLETPIRYEKISFNVKYLLDFLKLVNRYSPSGVITMHINESGLSKQFIFTATIGSATHIEYLLLPIVR